MRLSVVDGSFDLQVSPWDRGFLYGDGVFETLRVYRGRPFALGEHLELLGQTARALEIEGVDEALALLEGDARSLAARAGGGDGVLRLLLTRRPGEAPLRAALIEPFSPLAPEVYGLGVGVETRFSPGGTLGPKTLSYLGPMEALRKARQRGLHEVLWVDERGGIGQGSTCNVVWVCGGRVVAPAPPGGRVGVTRRWLLEAARAEGYGVEERPIYPQETREKGELLLCSTLREVVAAVELDGERVGQGEPGPAAARWRLALQRAAGG